MKGNLQVAYMGSFAGRAGSLKLQEMLLLIIFVPLYLPDKLAGL
jgi:hypothetical protein